MAGTEEAKILGYRPVRSEHHDHRIWGWVVYRCTYEDDDDWEEWKVRFLERARLSLEEENGLDLFDSMSIIFLEDREKLDNASAAVVRDHFKTWVAENAASEQGGADPRGSPRYEFCMQVDSFSLRSNLDAEDPEEGSVMLVEKDWVIDTREDANHSSLEPIDGCIQWEVGWGRFEYMGFLTYWYANLRDPAGWGALYRRPPEISEA